jgi:HicB family
MELSEYIEAMHRELASITRVAGAEAARAAEMVAQALDPSVRLTLLEVLSAAAAEITERLDGTVVEVRLTGGEPSFVVQAAAPDITEEPGQPGSAEADDAGMARMTLRLSQSLKERVEAAAAADGVSVNAWLAQAARQALEGPGGRPPRQSRYRPGQRITGFAVS